MCLACGCPGEPEESDRMVTDWVLALLPWLIAFPLLTAFTAWAWWRRGQATRELWQTMRQHFGDQVAGDTDMPWLGFQAYAPDLRVTGPGSVTTGMVHSGLMRVDTTAALPDLMVTSEDLTVMLFGMNRTRPIPTGVPAFDAIWRVTPVTGPTGQMAPPGAYLAWARPDVVEALRLLDFPLLQVTSGQLTLCLPWANVLGVDLAVRAVRTITALSQRQSPPALTLPRQAVVNPRVADHSGPEIIAGFVAGLVLFGGSIALTWNEAIPGSNPIACPAGGDYGTYCRYGHCVTRGSGHRSETGCAIQRPTGMTFQYAEPAASTLSMLWYASGTLAWGLAIAGLILWNSGRVARLTQRLLERGSRGE